jgi:hypothetical protein
MRIQLVFRNWESKAFIAKTIVHHPDVQQHLKTGTIAIGRGTTNAFIIREFLKVTNNINFDIDLDNYVAGVIDGELWLSDPETRTPEVVFRQGQPSFEPMADIVDSCDLVIKGGNALGTDWTAGVLCAHPKGGTIGSVYATCISKGIKILVPISMEKFIPVSIADIISNLGGQNNIDYARGEPVSLFPVVGGEIYSEIEAIDTIATVNVFPIASGGINDGAGSITVEIEGIESEIQKITALFEEIKEVQPLNVNLKPR